MMSFSVLICRPSAAAHHRRHPGAYNRQRLENAGAEHVQGVREEDRSDQRSLLQVLQRHHSSGWRARGKNTKFQFFGTDQRPAHTRP